MNNYTNMTGLNNTDMNVRAYEIEEAKRRMGMVLNSVPNLNSSMSVGYSEIQKAKQHMNTGSSTSFMS